MRVGLLTGGGDCPGLNAVIRAVTKSLLLRCGAEVVGFEDGFLGLIEGRYRQLDYRAVSGILTRGGTILGTSNKANPFRYFARDGADVSDEVVQRYRDMGLDAIVVIGGDGTMTIAHGLQEKGLALVGVPKTIDNDIVGTDRTFGFDTAVTVATEAIDRLHSTAQSHHRVMILETMGRYAGWIALHAGIASGSDVILLPEFPYDIDVVAEVCRKRGQGGQRFTIVAIAEGAKPEGGEMAIKMVVADSPDPIRLGGAGNVLAHLLEQRLESEVRTTILGHVQRGGTPTPFDRVLSTHFGSQAACIVEEGRSGVMVALHDGRMAEIPLADVAGKVRNVTPNGPHVRAALSVGTSFGVRDISAEDR
ncbi:MAG: ATP-dependent 6-phosphofructokinase [Bacteroidetes bacterium]|nr:ATP-dependent 6-phosphofructokinase [Bacteroidota bacterium]